MSFSKLRLIIKAIKAILTFYRTLKACRKRVSSVNQPLIKSKKLVTQMKNKTNKPLRKMIKNFKSISPWIKRTWNNNLNKMKNKKSWMKKVSWYSISLLIAKP